MNILIIKLGALGDVVNTLPLAGRLKTHFGARISWLVAPLGYPLVAEHAFVDRVILFDRHGGWPALRRTFKQLRSHEFDVALDLQRTLKSGIFCMAAKAKRRIGFDRSRCKEMTWLLPFERIPATAHDAHMLSQYMEFADYLGAPQLSIQWAIPSTVQMRDRLPESYVVLNIGATKQANQWTAEGFSSLARLIHQNHGLQCVITGGREDRMLADRILSHASGPNRNVIDLVGKTTLAELMAVLKGARAVVSGDTGPMHLAVAMGKKVVALFGPADHNRTGPYRGKVIRKRVACAPCNRKSCDDPLCMMGIDARMVAQVLSGYLDCVGES